MIYNKFKQITQINLSAGIVSATLCVCHLAYTLAKGCEGLVYNWHISGIMERTQHYMSTLENNKFHLQKK